MFYNYDSIKNIIKKNNDVILNNFKNATSNLNSSNYFLSQKGREIENMINVVELPKFSQIVRIPPYTFPSSSLVYEPPKVNIPKIDMTNLNFDIKSSLLINMNNYNYNIPKNIIANITDTTLINNVADHNKSITTLLNNIRTDYIKTIGSIAIKELKPYDSELNRKLPTLNTNKENVYGLLSDLFIMVLENYIVELTHQDMAPLALILFKWGLIILFFSED